MAAKAEEPISARVKNVFMIFLQYNVIGYYVA
jgi:hypothetical protein